MTCENDDLILRPHKHFYNANLLQQEIKNLEKKIIKAICKCEIYIELDEGDPINCYLREIIKTLSE